MNLFFKNFFKQNILMCFYITPKSGLNPAGITKLMSSNNAPKNVVASPPIYIYKKNNKIESLFNPNIIYNILF